MLIEKGKTLAVWMQLISSKSNFILIYHKTKNVEGFHSLCGGKLAGVSLRRDPRLSLWSKKADSLISYKVSLALGLLTGTVLAVSSYTK